MSLSPAGLPRPRFLPPSPMAVAEEIVLERVGVRDGLSAANLGMPCLQVHAGDVGHDVFEDDVGKGAAA